MKKFLLSFFVFVFFSQSASAINTYPTRSNATCKYNPSFFTPNLKETLNYNGKNYLVHERFGNYYVNGEMIGTVYDKSYVNGVLSINGKAVTQYGLNVASNTLMKDSATSLFITAYAKFVAKDYENASDFCRKVLALDANHRKATVLLSLSDSVLAGKLTPENAQMISDNSLEKIIKSAEGF